MAWTWLSWTAREYSSLLHYVCPISGCILDWRSVLFTEGLRVCRSNCTERAGSIVRLARVPPIPCGQDPGGKRRMVAGCVRSGTRSAPAGNNVAYLCTGGIGRADWVDCVRSLHSCPRSRSAQLIGKMAYDECETPAIF